MFFLMQLCKSYTPPKGTPYKRFKSAQEKLIPKTDKVNGKFRISKNDDLHDLNLPPSTGMVSIFGRL